MLRVLEFLAGLGALAGCAYYALCLLSVHNFLRDAARRPDPAPAPFLPPVSMLKPLRGADPGMYESFRSHCLQDYPEYELIFGVDRPDDPAAELVERLRREFPARAIKLVVCPEVLGANRKVSNLAQMLPHARHDFLLVNDSDIRVEGDYLRRVVAPLHDARVGLVTCLYRGIPAATLGSRLEALAIGTDFAPGVLAARQLEGIRFGLGSTLAFSRRALEAIGGFAPLEDYLADDYELGARISGAGFVVLLCDAVVETHLPPYSLRGFFQHQLRWARGIRVSRPGSYAGLALTFGLPWAMAAVALARGAAWAWILLGIAAVLRLGVAFAVGRTILRDQRVLRDLWLILLRDLIAVVVFAASYAGRRIAWRGDHFVLDKGKLRPA